MGKKKKVLVARTFDEYNNIIKDITQKNRDNYIFRGQRDIKWDIECGLSRQLKNNLSIDNDIDLKKAMFHYQREMLLRIKRKKYKEYKDLSDIDILAHQQHIGAATIMIDFTKSHLVALYFACLSIRVEQDGVVFLTDKSDERYRDYDKYKEQYKLNEIGNIWYPASCIYLYDPGQLTGRILSQCSVLVFNSPVIPKNHFKQIKIWGGGKDKMLEELSSLEINEEKLFNDPYGFARANSCNSAINIELLPEEQQSNVQKYNVDKLEKKEENKDYIFYMAIATMNYEIGAYKDAISNLNKALKLKPDFAEAYNNRGVAKGKMGKYEEAIDDFTKAIEKKPDYAEAYNNRGNDKGNMGKYEEAIADYDKALKLKPDFAEAYNNRGVAKGKMGKYEEAIDDFTKAIEKKPDYAEAYNNRGNAKGKMGKYEEAIDDYDKALKLKPDYAEAYVSRGASRFFNNDLDGSLSDFNEALKITPDDLRAQSNKSHVLIHLDRPEESLEIIEKILEKDKEYTLVYSNRAFAYCKLGNKDKADKDIKIARELAEKKNDTQAISEIEKVEKFIQDTGCKGESK